MFKEVDNKPVDVTIASGASLSSAVDLGGYTLCSIEFPATITGMTAICIEASGTPNGTYVKVTEKNDTATLYEPDAAASKRMPVGLDVAAGLRYIKIRSTNGSGTNANVSQDTTLTLHLKQIW